MIELVNLTKKYGKKIALDRITAKIDKGIVGVIGPNGAGKSTLFGVLAGVLNYEGECKIFEIECRNTKKVHQIASFSLDNPYFPNVKVKDLLQLAGVDKEIMSEFQAEELLNKNFNSLSMGQMKIVTLAIALGKDADVYILDEPTANLDVDKRDIFYRLLLKKAKNVVISSHELSEISNILNKALIIRNGKILFNGTLQELIQKYKNTFVIKTDTPDMIRKIFGDNASVFGNLVIIEGLSSIDEVWEKLKKYDVNNHIFGIEKADLNIIYRRMVNDNI